MTRLAEIKVNIISPKDDGSGFAGTTNLISNPSFENDTLAGATATGWDVVDGTIEISNTYARRGVQSCKVTPAGAAISILYFSITLTAATEYTLSMDILDSIDDTYILEVIDVATIEDHDFYSDPWTGTGHWHRRSFTFTAGHATEAYYVEIRNTYTADPFYIDGVQLEYGDPSTYLDGDMIGFVNGEVDYRWNGAPHASASWRSNQTRSGGEYTDISDYGKVLQIPGLGMSPVTNVAVSSTLGGSFYQNTVTTDRPFSIICNINASPNDYGAIEKARSALLNAIKPDMVMQRQPMLLQIDQLDSTGLEIAETLEIACLYQGGLEMKGSENAYNEKVQLDFISYDPYFKQQGESCALLTYSDELTSVNNIIKRNPNGLWEKMGTGANSNVMDITGYPRSSDVYVGGYFTTLNSATMNHIGLWNNVTETFSALTDFDTSVTGTNDYVYALKVDAAGNVYVGGTFTLAGGVANTAYIAKWNGINWLPLSTGTGSGVYALAVGYDGTTIYVGGTFTDLGDANGDNIVKWTGSGWGSLGSGLDGAVMALAYAGYGKLYAGGYFTHSGALDLNYVGKWNGTAWSAMGTGMDDYVNVMCVGADGMIYAGGQFHTAGGLTVNHVAKWNGQAWMPMGTGTNGDVESIVVSPWGNLIVGGNFTTAGGVACPSGLARWNGTSWTPLNIELGGVTKIPYALYYGTDNTLYVSGAFVGTCNAGYPYVVDVANTGSASVYPVIKFTGPGTVYELYSFSTNRGIYFNNLTLAADEVAILDLDPTHCSFTSSFRGNIINLILPGSSMDFDLRPGDNLISSFTLDGTADTRVTCSWRARYWSIDGAVW
jgi:hypothetical protein